MAETANTAVTPTMPTQDELNALWTALADFAEEALRPLALRVHGVINAEKGAASVTFEDVGALLVEINDCHRMLTDIARDLDSLKEAALEDLPFLARDGELASIPQYDDRGYPNFVDEGGKRFLTAAAAERYFPDHADA
jgi:hypothetical protein